MNKRDIRFKKHLEWEKSYRAKLNRLISDSSGMPSMMVNLSPKLYRDLVKKINNTPPYYIDDASAFFICVILNYYKQILKLCP